MEGVTGSTISLSVATRIRCIACHAALQNFSSVGCPQVVVVCPLLLVTAPVRGCAVSPIELNLSCASRRQRDSAASGTWVLAGKALTRKENMGVADGANYSYSNQVGSMPNSMICSETDKLMRLQIVILELLHHACSAPPHMVVVMLDTTGPHFSCTLDASSYAYCVPVMYTVPS